MSKKSKAPLTEKEVSQLLEAQQQEHQLKDSPQRKKVAVEKIVQRAKSESSAKAVAEYTLISMWTAALEFVALFCTFINQKSVDKNKPNSKD